MKTYRFGDSLPGPGDPETWPAYIGHPNDPRGDPDESVDDDWTAEEIAEESARLEGEWFADQAALRDFERYGPRGSGR